MGTTVASAARITGAVATALAGAVLAARRTRHARRVTAYVVSGGGGVPGVVTPIRIATNTAGPPITVGTCPTAIAIT